MFFDIIFHSSLHYWGHLGFLRHLAKIHTSHQYLEELYWFKGGWSTWKFIVLNFPYCSKSFGTLGTPGSVSSRVWNRFMQFLPQCIRPFLFCHSFIYNFVKRDSELCSCPSKDLNYYFVCEIVLFVRILVCLPAFW